MNETHTPLFLMEKKEKPDIEAYNIEDALKINTLLDELQQIFDFELSLPEYYDQKNLYTKWQSKMWQIHIFH